MRSERADEGTGRQRKRRPVRGRLDVQDAGDVAIAARRLKAIETGRDRLVAGGELIRRLDNLRKP